jgi:tetratricopeptide (TPR) repeat protein
MRLVAFFCLLSLLLASLGRVEAAEPRYALVIGNAKYPDNESPLKEPVSDMKAMAAELKAAGFDVTVGENLSGDAMRRAFAGLYEKIKPGSVAMIFFSGYGIQSGRQSFMIPVDSAIWDEKDVRRDGISLDTVLSEMNSRGASVKIAILDASRRNPFERRFRQFSTGLAPVTAPRGTLVMYSAPPGTVVNDAPNDRSLFVQELLKEIRAPDLTAEEAFNRTRVGVSRVSKGDQIPWFSSSLAEEFSFGPRSQAKLDTRPPPPPERVQPEIRPPDIRPPDLPRLPETKGPTLPERQPETIVVPERPKTPVKSPEQVRFEEEPAMRELTNLIVANPNDQAAFYKRGQLYAVKGFYAAALEDFDNAIRLNPRDHEALNNRCWVKMIMGNPTALKDCNDALGLRPNFADALDSRGLVNLKNGQNANAIADFDAALRLNPKLASSLYGRGIARQRTGAGPAGDRDLAAARTIDANIASDFAIFGIR